MQELKCLRCNTTMVSMGRKEYQEVLHTTGPAFRLYHCPSCGKVEFFVLPAAEPPAEEKERNRVRQIMAEYEAAYRRKAEKDPE